MSSNFSRTHFASSAGDPSRIASSSNANGPSLRQPKNQPPPTPSTNSDQADNQDRNQDRNQDKNQGSDRPRAGRSVRLINAINLISLSKLNIDETSILDLMLLNILFGVGYCVSLASTSFLLSRLYLTSKDACKLAILGALLSVLAINTLNTCWFRSGLGNWPASSTLDALNDFGCELKSLTNFSSLQARTSLTNPATLWCALVYHIASLPISLLTPQNVYTAQTALYLLYGFFQAQLEYSTRLLLIERFSQEKLLRVISLHRFMIGLGHLSLLFVRIIVKRLNAHQFVRPFCESEDCRTVVSSCIVACSSSIAVLLVRFISNRSVAPARRETTGSIKKPGKVVKKTSWLGTLVRPFKAFKPFQKQDRPDSRLVCRPELNGSDFTATNRLKKQLSDSDLKALEVLRDLTGQRDLVNLSDLDEKKQTIVDRRPALRRTKSDLQLTKAEASDLDFNCPPNYLVDCIQCGRYYIVAVQIDLDKVDLVEICLSDDLKINVILQNG